VLDRLTAARTFTLSVNSTVDSPGCIVCGSKYQTSQTTAQFVNKRKRCVTNVWCLEL
jgi:hypothetical protein